MVLAKNWDILIFFQKNRTFLTYKGKIFLKKPRRPLKIRQIEQFFPIQFFEKDDDPGKSGTDGSPVLNARNKKLLRHRQNSLIFRQIFLFKTTVIYNNKKIKYKTIFPQK
jgi:hypothetical protein